MSLREYKRKRDFHKTAEPAGKVTKRSSHRFVIQKHAASHLHYDFRLELGGTLKSWAVPKGMPYKKGEKRLAVHVEDHPIDYIDFEGAIPKGEYGGGTVMVWDRGTFEPLSKAPLKELKGGKLHFVLHGEKLEGEWYLVRLREGRHWLLIRGSDDMRPVSRKMDNSSALSGKTMKQLALGDRVWHSHPVEKPRVKTRLPRFIEPMKAKLVDAAPAGDWIYEIKFDGWRALAMKGGGELRLLSRNQKDFSAKFPEIAQAISDLSSDGVVLDGEIVALDPKGRSSFQLLQAFDLGEKRPPILFYAFDLLELDGKSLRTLPIEERKKHLEKVLKNAPDLLRFSDALGTEAEPLLKQAAKLGLEGLIGKKLGSHYEAGRRSGSWIKLKILNEQEFVIGGYTDPEGTRKHFGSLIVGVHEKGKLLCTGKVGTGFNQKLLASLHAAFGKIGQKTCPFANLPHKDSGRWGQGITPAEMKRCHWLKPRMVCQLKFTEWTRDGRLRHPVFLGLRKDKHPREVVREKKA